MNNTTEISPTHLDPIYEYFDHSCLGNDNRVTKEYKTSTIKRISAILFLLIYISARDVFQQ